jgi:hypothetical protein
MKPLSPIDALNPAFARARSVLGQPFRFWFFVKIVLIAALTQPSFYSVMISYPIQGLQFGLAGQLGHRAHHGMGAGIGSGAGSSFLAASSAPAIMVIVFVVMALVGMAIWVVASYLFCRLRFTLFDLVVYRHGRIGQGWSKYGRQTWRFFGLLILVSLAFLLLAAVTLGPFILHLVGTFRKLNPAEMNANPFAVLGVMFPIIGIVLLLALLWSVVDAVMQDFLLPPIAIEDAPLESAFRRFFDLLGNRIGTVLLYLLLRFVVSLGLSYVLVIVVLMVLGVLGLGGAGLGFVLYQALWHAGLGGQAVFFAYCIAALLVLMAVYFLAMISIYGTVAIFKQSYAAYFFGSYYPELGDRLEPPPPPDERLVGVQVTPPLPPLPPLQSPPPLW